MIAVLIPALNAESTLGVALAKVQTFVPAGSVIVIDDGSTDHTARIAKQAGVHLIQHPANRGKGAALRSGFEYILKRVPCECVITLDADLQHEPNEIPRFISEWKRGEADLIVGQRERQGSQMPLLRRLSNMITSYLVSARAGASIKDSQSGYRCISTRVLSAVRVESDGYEAETELLIKAARAGFCIKSVPISTIYGNERSYMTHWRTTRRFLQVLMKEY